MIKSYRPPFPPIFLRLQHDKHAGDLFMALATQVMRCANLILRAVGPSSSDDGVGDPCTTDEEGGGEAGDGEGDSG